MLYSSSSELLVYGRELHDINVVLDRLDYLFAVTPDPEQIAPPFYSVVDTLISQVHSLEDRLNVLQSSSDISVLGSPINDSPLNLMPLGGTEYVPSKGLTISSSVQCTPQKPRNKLTISSSLPGTPQLERAAATRDIKSPRNTEDFVSSVKSIRRLGAVRNLVTDFEDAQSSVSTKSNVPTTSSGNSDTSSSVCTQATVFRRVISNKPLENSEEISAHALEVLESHQRLLNDGNLELDQPGLELVSLSSLWKKDHLDTEVPTSFTQKLHEEKLRRQHCEQLIQQLQHSMLQLQERLSVAVQVDEAKDKAIQQLRESFEVMVGNVQELTTEKYNITTQLMRVEKKSQTELDECKQKILHYENELSKAINGLQTNKAKMADMEYAFTEIQRSLSQSERKAEDYYKKYISEMEKNRMYPEIIAQKEIEITENRNVLADARKEVAQSKRSVEICQNELAAMKSENSKLQKINEDHAQTVKSLNDQNARLLSEIEAHVFTMNTLQNQLDSVRAEMERSKVDLRNFYQGQVELVVQTKVKEFQAQIDELEMKYKDEVKRRELSVAKKAAMHIQQLSEKNDLEVHLLEQRHEEQLAMHQLRTAQLKEELDDVKSRMRKQQERNSYFYRLVTKFIESIKQDQGVAEMCHASRSRSYSSLEEVIVRTINDSGEGNSKKCEKPNYKVSNSDEVSGAERTVTVPEVVIDSRPSSGSGGGQLTYRVDSARSNDCRSAKVKHKDADLRHVIDQLLDRPAGCRATTPTHQDKQAGGQCQEPSGTSKGAQQKDRKAEGKKPWK